MTPPAGAGPEVAELIRRLRARPVSSWSHGDREAVMRRVLQDLANLAAKAREEAGARIEVGTRGAVEARGEAGARGAGGAVRGPGAVPRTSADGADPDHGSGTVPDHGGRADSDHGSGAVPDHGGRAVVARRPVPDVGVAALVDQFVVLLRDVESEGADPSDVRALLDDMARALSLRL